MNRTMYTFDNLKVTCLNFNYEYILLDADNDLPEEIAIELGEYILLLNCTKMQEKDGGKGVLYQINGWREIAKKPKFRSGLFQLLGYQEEASGFAQNAAAAGSMTYV